MSIPRAIIAILAVFAVFGGANYYAARRLYQWLYLLFPNINIRIYIGIFIFLALSIILGFLRFPFGIIRFMNVLSAYWMGIFMYLVFFFLIADVVTLAVHLIKPETSNIRFYTGLAVILLTCGFTSFGLYNANQIKTVKYDIQLKDFLLNDMKIVLISDLHLGGVNSEKNLKDMVDSINKVKPDIVCIAGDIFTDDFKLLQNPEKAASLFKSIESIYGVYACLGNHDGGPTLDLMMNFLKENKIKLLNDEYVIIDERLALFGRLDSSPIGGSGELKRHNISTAITSVSKEKPIIVIDHNPANIKEYGNETDLILSGHTHYGQIFPGNLMTKMIFTVAYGHYQKDENSPHVIVSSGAGTWRTPMRVGSKNEVVVVTVK